MSVRTFAHRSRALVGALAATALVTTLVGLVPTAAHAAPLPTKAVTVTDGSITWGLHTSFRNYITGVAGGTVTATAPATDPGTGAGATTFPNGSGKFSLDKSTNFATEGSVNYTAHGGLLDLTLSEPRLVVSPTGAELVVDAIDSDAVTHDDLAIATVDLDGHVTADDDEITISGAPVTLLASGEVLFYNNGSPMYPAGTALAPLDAALTVAGPPTVTVSRTEFFADGTGTVTVTGSGFDPSAAIGTRAPFLGLPSGVYIAFGRYADEWQPSSGAANTSRNNPTGANGNGVAVKWAVPAASFAASNPTQVPGSGPYTILNEDGTFETQISVNKSWLDDKSGNFGIYTYAGGGPTVADYETYTPITFIQPSVQVSKTEFFTDESATVTVTGSGFNPNAVNAVAGPTAGKPAGTFVTFSKFSENWKPSESAPPANRPRNAAPSVKWALLSEDIDTVGGPDAGAIELHTDGTFTAEVEVDKSVVDALNTSSAQQPLRYGIYTYAGGVATSYAPYETFTPVSFVKHNTALSVADVTTTVGTAATVTATVSAGATGDVTLSGLPDGPVTAVIDNGSVSFAIPADVATGSYALTAAYAGDDNYTAANATATLSVEKQAEVPGTKANAVTVKVKVAKKPTSRKKGVARIVATGNKAAAPAGKVRIKLVNNSGKQKTVVAKLKKGKARVKLPKLAKGTWQVQVSFRGDAKYAATGFTQVNTIRVTK
jgi:hypothetical protein